jgi:hypothetical protein
MREERGRKTRQRMTDPQKDREREGADTCSDNYTTLLFPSLSKT